MPDRASDRGDDSPSERISDSAPNPPLETLPCDVCGAAEVHWIKCKLVCQHCRTILMSCEDV